MSDGTFLTKRDITEAAEKVIRRWVQNGMLRFGPRDDGSDDLLLAAEIARVAMGQSA